MSLDSLAPLSIRLAAAVCLAPLHIATAATAATEAAIPVQFTPRIAAPDLTISRVTAELRGDQVRFAVDYTSGREGYLSFFDPPRGATIKVLQRGALKTGSGRATVDVPAARLRHVASLTLRFSADEPTDTNFLFLIMTVPGIVAHQSALKDGERLKIPTYERPGT